MGMQGRLRAEFAKLMGLGFIPARAGAALPSSEQELTVSYSTSRNAVARARSGPRTYPPMTSPGFPHYREARGND